MTLLKLIFWPIKLVLKALSWIALIPIRVLLTPVKITWRIFQFLLFLALVAVIAIIVLVIRGDI